MQIFQTFQQDASRSFANLVRKCKFGRVGSPENANREEQRRLYGATLGELLSDYATSLSVSQARLAGLLGLSPPMLSQLMNARRVKIGNPSAVRQLQTMHEVVADVKEGAMAAEEAITLLEAAREGGDVFTKTTTRPREIAVTVQSVLRALAPREKYERAARVLDVDHPDIAVIVRVLGAGDPSEAARLIERAQGDGPSGG